jgi:GNAT superfamily N-acetyltransferase
VTVVGPTSNQGGPTNAVRVVGADEADAVVDVLTEAFDGYPVMRWVLGPRHDDPVGLRRLVDFFVMARVYRGETLLGIGPSGDLDAAALVSRAGASHSRPLALLREEVWRDLGDDARERYWAFGSACARSEVDVPHIHPNMLGVRRPARGTGMGRILLEHVHRMSAEDPVSTGVSLTTESPANVPLYRHFGYRVVGEADVSPTLHTWGFFRDDDPAERSRA